MAAGFDQIYSLLLELWLLIKVAIIEPSCLPLIILVLVTAFGWYYRDEDGPLVRSQALLDFLYPILNVVFFGWFYATLILVITKFYLNCLPFLNTGLLDDKPVWLQAVGAFLIVDFTLFITHYLQHKLRWVWYFHTIHHSQEHISALTALRIHWIEYLFDAIIVTVPIAFVGGDISTWFLLALFNNSWGYVVHANARIPLGPLEYLIVTPQYHRLHHSKNPQHFDKNFCERLTLWDFIFGTMCMDFDSVRETGVDGFPVETPERSLSALLNRWKTQTIYPFRLLMQDLHKAISQRT